MKKLISGLALITFMLSMSSGKGYAAEALGFEISGFVDSSYTYDDNGDMNSFNLDQIEIDISKEITDWASLRFDLQHCPSAGLCGPGNTVPDDDIIEQGYLTLTAPVANGVTFTFGKFNAPIGFELLDPVDMYQFSHSLVFNNGLPTNLTGAMLSTSFNMFDINFYVVNGWDNNPETNKNKSIGGRLGITPMEGVNVGFSAISGVGDGGGTQALTVFDIDGTITLIPKLTVGLEFNFGSDNDRVATGNDADWFGFLVMGHYDYTDWGGITVRYDYFDDDDSGTRIGFGSGSADAATVAGVAADTRQAITIAPTFVIAEGFGALFEYRHDFSDKNVFVKSNGTATDTNDSLAFEIIS